MTLTRIIINILILIALCAHLTALTHLIIRDGIEWMINNLIIAFKVDINYRCVWFVHLSSFIFLFFVKYILQSFGVFTRQSILLESVYYTVYLFFTSLLFFRGWDNRFFFIINNVLVFICIKFGLFLFYVNLANASLIAPLFLDVFYNSRLFMTCIFILSGLD